MVGPNPVLSVQSCHLIYMPEFKLKLDLQAQLESAREERTKLEQDLNKRIGDLIAQGEEASRGRDAAESKVRSA